MKDGTDLEREKLMENYWKTVMSKNEKQSKRIVRERTKENKKVIKIYALKDKDKEKEDQN